MKRWWPWVLGSLIVAGAAFAVGPGETLYIKAKNTRLMASSAPSAKVLAVLQPGMPVTYQAPDVRGWHKVTAEGKTGVVFQSNLARERPTLEILHGSGSAGVDPVTFASSAAATKALGDGAIDYGTRQNAMSDSVNQLLGLEDLSRKVRANDLAEHEKKAGISPAVGREASR